MRRGGAPVPSPVEGASPLLVNMDESELETGRPRPASGVGTIWRAKRILAGQGEGTIRGAPQRRGKRWSTCYEDAPRMGYGDDIMVTAEARRLKEVDPQAKIVVGDGVREVWSETGVFDRNPHLSRLADVAPGDRIVWLRNYYGCRPYLDYERSEPGRRQAFRPYRAEPGVLCFSREETAHAAALVAARRQAMPVVAIEPNVDFGPTKDWGFERWQATVDSLRDRVTFVQPSYGRPILDGVHAIESTFRSFAAVLLHCDLYVGPEGGLHHAAAAVGLAGVVVFGGRISPQLTGYDLHDNLYVEAPGSPCGMIEPCQHCRACFAAIPVERVVASVQQLLRRALSRGDLARARTANG